jgi:hemerythrin
VLRLLDYLEAYTLGHFAEEEAFQLQIGYPRFKEHKLQHDKFRARVAELRQEIGDWE